MEQGSQNQAPQDAEKTKPTLDEVLSEAMRWLKHRHQMDRKEVVWANVRKASWMVFFVFLALLQFWFLFRTLGAQPLPSDATVAVIPIDGPIAAAGNASADKVVPMIEKACEKDGIGHIVLRINSPGGSPNESERVVSAVEACRAEHKKKFTMLIDGVGASAAYMIAVHGDRIVAGRYSLVGSVGAIMRYVDAHSLANRFGLNERVFRSGTLKGGPSMLSGSDEQMDGVNQELVSTLGQDFLSEVVSQRKGKLKLTSPELFTGRIWTGPQALELGLVDKVATFEELKFAEFKDSKVIVMKPKSPIGESFGAKAFFKGMIRETLTELEEPSFQ